MSEPLPTVSIVIPTWNGRHHLERCLPALDRQRYRSFEILIVDNGSEDDTVTWLQTHRSDCRLIALPRNRGFAHAVNRGIAAARGRYIVLLNNDTEAEAEWLGALVAEVERHPSAGMVASRLRLWDDRSRLHAAGDYFSRRGTAGNRGVWERDGPRWSQAEWIFGPCAAAALYRRELFAQVGPFDERFGSYLEDVDLAWRAQLAGYRCRYAPEAIVYHRVSATGGGALASYFNGRNNIYLLVKSVPAAVLRRHWSAILREQLAISIAALRAWRGAAARARLRGQGAGLLALPRLLRWRRANQPLHHPALTNDEILALLDD